MHSCIYPDMVYDYQPYQYTHLLPPEIDERIMKLRRQQLDKKQTQESSLVKLKLNGVIKTFQQEETLLQRWATTELLINRQPCIL